ncbi:hypothetical protein FHS83_000971 [Rhizomicrobium palustre]|uniref:Uncharacterized protein n=1 Tax=Rhizomicrobium palustre TaxID=189966 RepID=A0A846MWD1_9PROT|nr:hypothetical protein [Rhizomicrobium palustre]NIK87653.1 hypothetical protein [Rhizomicrobium palustre]
MNGKKPAPALWMDEPEEHDYPAAEDYLSLIFVPKTAEELARKLKKARILRRKAKDLLRASGLIVLGKDNYFVQHNLDKIASGKALSPVLLVRGDAMRHIPLIVADGYHRICASWHHDENAVIPCRIVNCP